MDDDPHKRQSSLPRPSRLPVTRTSAIPKPASSIARPSSTTSTASSSASRTTDGRSSAAGGATTASKLRAPAPSSQPKPSLSYGDTRASKLRSSASREQLKSYKTRPSPANATPHKLTAAHRATRLSSSASLAGREGSLSDFLPPEETEETPSAAETEEAAEEGKGQTDEGSSHEISIPKSRAPKKPRPSLSERTMETLAHVPSSPALRKKSSAFFDPAASPSRVVSGSQQGSNADNDEDTTFSAAARTPANNFKSSLSTIDSTPRRASAKTPSRASLGPDAADADAPAAESRSPSPEKKSQTPKITSSSKTMASRLANKRIAPKVVSKKASSTAASAAASAAVSAEPEEVSESGWDGSITPIAPRQSQTSGGVEEPLSASRKSSSALREQIAKAKAAKRAALKQSQDEGQVHPQNEVSIVPADDGFDFGVAHGDPFNLNRGAEASRKVLHQRLVAARSSGRLNIAALGLKEIPDDVMRMYDLENIHGGNGSWAEAVDVTRFVAADNELESLGDAIFPDRDPHSYSADDDDDDDDGEQGNMFGGLETIDLHGNLLMAVPIGLRRLHLVTSLNLSSNRLTGECLGTIAQMPALRDLKLANNSISGQLPWELTQLEKLEILDMAGNGITGLPAEVEKMSRLRILNLRENCIESLDFRGLAQLPLTELSLYKNRLSGTLIREPIASLQQLQTLDVSVNKLEYLVPLGAAIAFPVLHALSLSVNRLQGLPDMSSWGSLLTLAVDENNISSIPNSFTSLTKLRNADFSGNDIRVIPPEVARMDSLSMLRISGNPLRDKKFITITTEELKEALATRLEPPPPYQATITDLMSQMADMDAKQAGHLQGLTRVDSREEDSRSEMDYFATPPTSAPQSPLRSRSRLEPVRAATWQVKQGGLLDRSSTDSSNLDPAMCARIAAEHHPISTVYLHRNAFERVPSSLALFARTLSTLSLSSNKLSGDVYMTEPLELPVLRELSMSNNRITSLEPLKAHLQAPALEKLDVSVNAIAAVPSDLKSRFPALSVLQMSTNQVRELLPESIRGIKVVDASSNEVAHLNPKLGLLAGSGGLASLEVAGNRFRVPRWDILQKGTEETLRWLRDRLPVEELAAWKKENGEESDDQVD